ncbi:hypothetical protein [Streptomyces sp. HNM0574]|uniref:hypothetical protein n=1 Tax=Streptomyces sp. HNM0574 TaxID=2714954 RepID=UPI00146EA8C4|nr:hypothetical protein [Streptomyces sp. HNM0574]NLU65773.1 hypothetical protein [Streptomyces sp. HNM0574]
MRGRTAPALALVAVTALGLGGCGQQEEPAVSVESLVGQSVAQAERKLPDNASMVSYDLSTPVQGTEPSYRIADDAGTDEEWTVVASCANTKNIQDGTELAVGILRTDTVTRKLTHQAKTHTFDKHLTECR